MTAPTTVDPWAGAACREPGIDANMFFPERGANGQIAAARAVCRRCPLQQQCGEYVMALEDQRGYRGLRFGVWAGMSPKQRTTLARKQRGAR